MCYELHDIYCDILLLFGIIRGIFCNQRWKLFAYLINTFDWIYPISSFSVLMAAPSQQGVYPNELCIIAGKWWIFYDIYSCEMKRESTCNNDWHLYLPHDEILIASVTFFFFFCLVFLLSQLECLRVSPNWWKLTWLYVNWVSQIGIGIQLWQL